MIYYKQKQRVMCHEVVEQATYQANRFKRDVPNTEDILEVLFSDENSNDFYVYWWDNPWKHKTTWWQRLNRLWFYPVFICAIMPVQWLVRGRVGFDERSKLGQIILNMVGEK